MFHTQATCLSEQMTNKDGYVYDNNNDELVALEWAAIEKLPTFKRLRTALLLDDDDSYSSHNAIDVRKLGAVQRQVLVDKLINHVEQDNRRLLLKMKDRMDRVGVKQTRVEVRFEELKVEAECVVVHGKPLPTLWNSFKSIFSVFAQVSCCRSQKVKLNIIKGVSGTIKPSRMTLLLGPPGCGKTTFLKALAGKLDPSLKVTGNVYYNDCILENLMPQKASAYISQYDLHLPEMTARETIDFSARCQGVENRTEIMLEVSRREKKAGIVPEPDIDAYMKATSVGGLRKTLQTDYTLKILGLDICADTIVGDAMRRGMSGGQKRRLATGEMIVGPRRAFFMDEISNGLDTSTTFQIITCLQQLVHITEATAVISLLQPAPETLDLFDDIILYAQGKIVYHGPRNKILKFFQDCGFKCPKRKGVADFLQEVISRKDQQQYWCNTELSYKYISVDDFSERFKAFHEEEAQISDCDCSKSQDNILTNSKYSINKWELFKACMDREILLMKRNSSLHTFKLVQLLVTALITMTVFLRTRMDIDLKHANYFLGSLFYGIIRILANGLAELTMTVSRLSVFYKQRDLTMYPAWAYSVPAFLLKVPLSMVESFLWTVLTYYVIGYSPGIERFFCQFLLFFALHQSSISLFRFLASICQSEVAAVFSSNVVLLIMLLFSGFIIPQSSIPTWLGWGFWTSPVSYAAIGVSVNEFLAPRWMQVTSANQTIGLVTLSSRGVNFREYFYWISLGALFAFTIIFNIGFTLALTFLKPSGTSRAFVSHRVLSPNSKDSRSRIQNVHCSNHSEESFTRNGDEGKTELAKTDMTILPFEPLTLTFQDIQYFVDTPQQMRKQGFAEKRLKLLHEITGAFRPGTLTALMGTSGAGKTTLMDVLSGRKTSGYILGTIKVGGYPKIQETFARISGYCEQNDIHSPQITVEESLLFSCWLRLPSKVDAKTKAKFVKDVLERSELDEIKDSLVGVPGRSGLSNEQRKRLTIAVELVSNPSVIFMDEPTSGLDARAAAIVMRAVKNIVETGRTVVCTIHQPSIDIFEAFDELILMRKGGQIIYSGLLGEHSCKLIEYLEEIPGVPKIKENYNPATWMLEVTSTAVEEKLGLDFAQIYKESPLYRENVKLVKELSEAAAGSREMHFPTRYPQNSWEQFKACLWKQSLSYWRSPAYNLTRILYMIISSVLLGAIMWQKGNKISKEQDLFNILSSVYIVLQLLGVNTCSSVVPVVTTERTILYREKFAGMYSSWVFSFAQVVTEVPYVFIQTLLFVTITYPAMGLCWSAFKLVCYFHMTFCKLLSYTYLGMLIVSVSSSGKVASILAVASYTILNLFSGFLIPEPAIPRWWVWCYWISPTSWFIRGIITSQYGDMKQEITVFGEKRAVDSFLEGYYGYHHDQLGLIFVVATAFPLFLACLFALCIQKLNFQRR